MEWQTKNLALVIAATVPKGEDGQHPLMDFAEGLTLATVEELKILEENERNKEPEAGSYEKLMSLFSQG